MERLGPFAISDRPFATAERYTVYSISATFVRKGAPMEVILRQQISKPDFDQCGNAAASAYNEKRITRSEYNLLRERALAAGYKRTPAQLHVVASRVPYLGLTNAESAAAKESIEQLSKVFPRQFKSIDRRLAA